MRKLFILFLFLFSRSALAVEVRWGIDGGTVSGYSSGDGACAAAYPSSQWKQSWPKGSYSGFTAIAATAGRCNASNGEGYTGYFATASSYTLPDCPSGQSRPEGSGTCGVPPPTTPKCDTPAGQKMSWSQKTGHSSSPDAEKGDGSGMPGGFPTSSPTCGLGGPPSVDKCWSNPAADGGQDFFCQFSGTSNGQNAPAGAPSDAGSAGAPGANSKPTGMPPTPAPPGGCPAGSTQGGVDSSGTPICIGSGTSPTGSNGGSPSDGKPTSSTTTKTTDSAGNSKETTKESRSNGDGSTTVKTTETTTAPDGSKSSTTSTTTGLTPGGKQGQPDKPDTDFCRLHPELNICRNSSISGQCGQISCMGDAIQCATLRAAAAMQCAQEKDVEAVKAMPSKALGDQILAGSDPLKSQIDAAIKGTEVDMSKVTLDQTGFLGGGSCLPDRSFSVMGKSVSVSFSAVCERIQPLRAAVMACAFIVAYLLVSRSVLTS